MEDVVCLEKKVKEEFCVCGHSIVLHHHADTCYGPGCACTEFWSYEEYAA